MEAEEVAEMESAAVGIKTVSDEEIKGDTSSPVLVLILVWSADAHISTLEATSASTPVALGLFGLKPDFESTKFLVGWLVPLTEREE